jgi:hypothetical protein
VVLAVVSPRFKQAIIVERYLTNLDVWCWRYWENQRNYPGLHFTAKPDSVLALKQCLDQLRREGTGAYRTIPLQPLLATDEAKITGGLKYESFQRLRLSLREPSDTLRQMSFRVDTDLVCFDFVEPCLARFEQGLLDVHNGRGDYSIGPMSDRKRGLTVGDWDRQSECLWFWPCFGHLWVVE